MREKFSITKLRCCNKFRKLYCILVYVYSSVKLISFKSPLSFYFVRKSDRKHVHPFTRVLSLNKLIERCGNSNCKGSKNSYFFKH